MCPIHSPIAIAFTIFGLFSLLGAACMVFAKSAVYSVVAFLFTMLSIAACYLCLQAEFLAMAQILVYAGGIVVLFLFVVMLVELSKRQGGTQFSPHALRAVVAIAIGMAAFVTVFWRTLFGPASAQPLVLKPELAEGLNVAAQNAQAVSRGLFSGYLLPFEILSVILLVALVGAVVLAKPDRV